jgi:hypothetical protein
MGILELKEAGKHTVRGSQVEVEPEASGLESVCIHPVN